jgi:hypothetical protein
MLSKLFYAVAFVVTVLLFLRDEPPGLGGCPVCGAELRGWYCGNCGREYKP